MQYFTVYPFPAKLSLEVHNSYQECLAALAKRRNVREEKLDIEPDEFDGEQYERVFFFDELIAKIYTTEQYRRAFPFGGN